MNTSLVCRDYRYGDESQILSLFYRVFQKEMSPAFWNWRFSENPAGKGIVKLAFDEEKLVGHYAVIPMNVQVQGRAVKAAFSMTTMTDPEYSGQGIFTFLAQETYIASQKRGIHFVYGFPNRNSRYGFEQKLGWQGLSLINTLEKKAPDKARRDPPEKTIEYIEHFDQRFDSLWERVKQDFQVIVPRTAKYLNWRFAKNPEVDYVKYIVYDDTAVLGYFILKVYTAGEVIKGHIADMLCINERKIMGLLLDNAYGYFAKEGISDITCWVPQNSFYTDFLLGEGFTSKETDTYFGTKTLQDDDILRESIEPFSNWHLTMADSDVF